MISVVKALGMKAPKQNCPRCNAVQSFRPRRRDTNDCPGVIEVYIRCTVCNWEHVLRQSTMSLERLAMNERRLLEQARVQHERHGTVNGTTRRLLTNVRRAMQAEREAARLYEPGRQARHHPT
jgi:hypothetical protein